MQDMNAETKRFHGIGNLAPERERQHSPETFANPRLRAVVDLDALGDNVRRVRRRAGDDHEIIACIKANAYGHGLRAIAECLQRESVRWLAVGSPEEALALRRWGIACRILLFPTVGNREHSELAAAGISIGIQSYEEAESVARAASSTASVFLKVDVGLGRFGVPIGELASLTVRMNSNLPTVKLDGIFTHLPFSDVDALPWIEGRMREFGRSVAEIRSRIETPLIVQAFSSDGIALGLKLPEANAVCPGQLLFGIEPASVRAAGPSRSLETRPVLREVGTLLGGLRRVPAGARFGFGGAAVASRETLLGVLPVGFSNSLLVSKHGQVASLLGQIAPIVGVGLEHAVVDVTGIPGVEEGCAVTLLDRDSKLGLTLDDLARVQQRLPVEVLTCLTARANYEYRGQDVPSRSVP